MTAHLLSALKQNDVVRVFDSPSKRFTDLVRAGGLDPSVDLKKKTLHRIVVQPEEDLTGYNFAGSDLSGAVLRRVDLCLVDLTNTILSCADLRGAKFAEKDRQRLEDSGALLEDLPLPLSFGKNRLWPERLEAEINQAILEASSESELSAMAEELLRDREREIAEHILRVVLDWNLGTRADNDAETLKTRFLLATAIGDQGRSVEAAEIFADVGSVRRALLGPDHIVTLKTEQAYVEAVRRQGRAVEAEEGFQRLLGMMEDKFGRDSEYALSVRQMLGVSILDQGRAVEAEKVFQEVLALRRNLIPTKPFDILATKQALAVARRDQGSAASAESMLREVLAERLKLSEEDHPHTLMARHALAVTVLAQGRTEEAQEMFLDLLPFEDNLQGKEQALAIVLKQLLAQTFLEQGQVKAAAELLDSLSNKSGELLLNHFRGHRYLIQAFLADQKGDATSAFQHLVDAQNILSLLSEEHYVSHMLEAYIATRMPGGVGGTLAWRNDEDPVG